MLILTFNPPTIFFEKLIWNALFWTLIRLFHLIVNMHYLFFIFENIIWCWYYHFLRIEIWRYVIFIKFPLVMTRILLLSIANNRCLFIHFLNLICGGKILIIIFLLTFQIIHLHKTFLRNWIWICRWLKIKLSSESTTSFHEIF